MLVELDRRQAVARNKEAGRNRVQKVVGAESRKELLCVGSQVAVVINKQVGACRT